MLEKYTTMLVNGGDRTVILVDTWQPEIVFIGNTHADLADFVEKCLNQREAVAAFLNQREAEMVTANERESVR